MPKCPVCKKNITYLHNDQSIWHRYIMGISRIQKGKSVRIEPNYVETKTWSADENVFVCPECDVVLFYSEDKAVAFLSKDLRKK